jgi:hypothetical protein
MKAALRTVASWMTPTSWVYVLIHLLLIVGGYLLIVARRPGELYASIFEAIGASLVASGITGIVVFVYIRISHDASERMRILAEFGIVSAFEARAARIKLEYDRRLKSPKNIDVMGFGLKALREDYRHVFGTWARECHVRVLLLDPTFPNATTSYARQREIEEGDTPGSIEASVKAFLDETQALRDTQAQSRFQVRLYRCLPAVNIFRVDDELFWGPYLIGGPSRNNPTLIVKRGGLLYARLMEQFDKIWNEMSRPA